MPSMPEERIPPSPPPPASEQRWTECVLAILLNFSLKKMGLAVYINFPGNVCMCSCEETVSCDSASWDVCPRFRWLDFHWIFQWWMQLFIVSCFPTIVSAWSKEIKVWGEITWKFGTVEQGPQKRGRSFRGSAWGTMSGQQAAANVFGLELNVKNGNNGIFVSQLLQGAVGEKAFRVYITTTPISNQTGSGQKQDWRGTNCLSMSSACRVNEIRPGRLLRGFRREGSLSPNLFLEQMHTGGLRCQVKSSGKVNPPTSWPKGYLAQEKLCIGGTWDSLPCELSAKLRFLLVMKLDKE